MNEYKQRLEQREPPSLQHMLKIVLVCLLGVCCVQMSAQDVNAWLQEQLNASADLRHVDYDEMYDKALQKDKGVDPLIRSLVVIDYCWAYGMDSLAIEMADFLLEKASNEQMDRVLTMLESERTDKGELEKILKKKYEGSLK